MTSKEEALLEAEETRKKVVEWKAAYEGRIERLEKEKAGLQAQLDRQAETMKTKTKEVEELTSRLEGFSALQKALGQIRGDIDYDKLAAEVAKRIPQGSAVDLDTLASTLFPKVLERFPASSGVRYVPAPPRAVILKSFMEAEVARMEERLKSLPADVKKVISYLQARGAHSTKRDLIIHVFGPSYASGAGYSKVSKVIDGALATGLIRKDTAGRLYPNLELKVEADLKPYEPTKEEVSAVVERVVYLVAQEAVRDTTQAAS